MLKIWSCPHEHTFLLEAQYMPQDSEIDLNVADGHH